MAGGKKERATQDLGKGRGGGQYDSPTVPACKHTLEVDFPGQIVVFAKKSILTFRTVHVRRGYWWNHRGSSHAFYRHSENPAAG